MSKVWSDYAAGPGGAGGDAIYGDYTVDGGTAMNVRSYEPGMGKVEPWTSVGAASASYYSTDMLGTTRYMTTPDDGQKERGGATGGGLATEGATYTAFGERISGTNHRYGYRAQDTAEDPGTDPVPFLHVGARYYDPAIGRFLQRDPIGIRGGLNVYEYVRNRPTRALDPLGLFDWFDAARGAGAAALPFMFGLAPFGLPALGVCVAAGLIMGVEEEDVSDAWDALKEELERSQERFEDQWDPSPQQSHDEWYCPGCREFQDADEPNHLH